MPFSDVFKRMGKTRVRVTFFIEVKTLLISSISGLDSGDDLNILFERGDKSVSSSPKTLESHEDDDLTTTFNEILKLDATLYRDANGIFQVKKLQNNTGECSGECSVEPFSSVQLLFLC